MINAIIFDLDDVILQKPEGRFSQRLGLKKELIDEFFGGVFQNCLVGKADLKEELPKIMHTWGWEKSMEELLDFWFTGEKNTDERMIQYIHKLREKGIKVLIGTNNEKHRLDYLERELGLSNLFHKVYGSYLIGYAKPNPQFFHHILKEQNVKAHETLFWDDKISNVEAARSCGIHGEVFTCFEDFCEIMNKYQL